MTRKNLSVASAFPSFTKKKSVVLEKKCARESLLRAREVMTQKKLIDRYQTHCRTRIASRGLTLCFRDSFLAESDSLLLLNTFNRTLLTSLRYLSHFILNNFRLPSTCGTKTPKNVLINKFKAPFHRKHSSSINVMPCNYRSRSHSICFSLISVNWRQRQQIESKLIKKHEENIELRRESRGKQKPCFEVSSAMPHATKRLRMIFGNLSQKIYSVLNENRQNNGAHDNKPLATLSGATNTEKASQMFCACVRHGKRSVVEGNPI